MLFRSAEEAEKFEASDGRRVRDHIDPRLIGQTAASIAAKMGFERPYPIKLLVAPVTAEHIERSSPLTAEKLAPLVSMLRVEGDDAGIATSLTLLRKEGAGHTAIIHTASPALAERFGLAMPAGRILVNSPGAQAQIGRASCRERV